MSKKRIKRDSAAFRKAKNKKKNFVKIGGNQKAMRKIMDKQIDAMERAKKEGSDAKTI